MKNLHDKRFYTVPKPEAWEYVAIPNKFRAAKIKYSIDSGLYYVSLVSVHPKELKKGFAPQHDVLHFRDENPEALRKRILESFSDAVFTVANSEPDDLKAQFQADQKAALERRQKEADAKQYAERFNAGWQSTVENLSPAEQEEGFNQAVQEFISNPEFSNQGWVAKFKTLPNFLSYPDNRWANKTTLKAFCKQRGWIVPQAAQLAEAFNYLFAHGHFFLKATFKRSERDTMAAVKPFEREVTLSETISENDIREAVRRLTAKFGLPVSVSIERLQACGVPNPEAMFEKLQQLYSVEPIADKSTAELKQDLQALRNANRGNQPRDRRTNMLGY